MLAIVVKVYSAVHGDGYEFGWSFWVAVGTLGLAFMTGSLAWKTRAVARETGNVAKQTQQLAIETTELAKRTSEDVAAQFRPILVPEIDPSAPQARVIVLNTGIVNFFVRNEGRGPALAVQATLRPDGVTADPWDNGVLPAGTSALVKFGRVANPEAGFTLAFGYEGLAGEPHETLIGIQYVQNHYRIADVSFA